MPITSVLLDAFGTLCVLRQPRSIARRLADSLRLPIRDLWREALTGRLAWDSLNAELRAELARELESFEILPETLRILPALRARGISTAIVSNVAAPYATLVNAHLAPLVDACLLSCELGVAKPDSAIFTAALDSLSAAAHTTLMIGDSPQADLKPASALGMRTALVDIARGGLLSNALQSHGIAP